MGAKAWLKARAILSPVAMKGSVSPDCLGAHLGDWREPDLSEAQALDVVEVGLEPCKVPTMKRAGIIPIGIGIIGGIAICEAIDQDQVDGLRCRLCDPKAEQ